jgi:ATP-dependent helicase/nuclease subunit B
MTDTGSCGGGVRTKTTIHRRVMERKQGRGGWPEGGRQLECHVGDEGLVFERAHRSPRATELVASPVELHQRNVQRRLREANLPKDAFSFIDPVGISKQVLESAGRPTATIDRIDRLSLVRSMLEDPPSRTSSELPLPPGISSRDPQRIEQIRTQVETVTNFHPERITAWRDTADDLYDPIDAESSELLNAALFVERGLRSQTTKAISETELVRRATRVIVATDGEGWTEAYPDIGRLTLLGLSSLSAPHTDLVHAILSTTPVEVHIHFRSETGAYLKRRFDDLLTRSRPGTEVFE